MNISNAHIGMPPEHVPQDLICFSHLRWNFVYQRPQHLLTRFAKQFRVFFVEEPEYGAETDILRYSMSDENVGIIVPHLRHGLSPEEGIRIQRRLLSEFIRKFSITRFIAWYYTPMALTISDHLAPELTIYDCMDELAAFRFAPETLKQNEKRLMSMADIVFTGGNSLYESKKYSHHNVHPFPSSIDKQHFSKARFHSSEPADQAAIPHPRFGFFGVIDERMDLKMIAKIASLKTDWHFVIIGPVVKIDPATLPQSSNIHYLGSKSYKQLPEYIAGWDVATIPFVLDESTQFISPTKTPEYLAAGKPVISTSITDVVNPYGENNLVHIADTAEEFILAGEKELASSNSNRWLSRVDNFLKDISWDNTWKAMMTEISKVYAERNSVDKYISGTVSLSKESMLVRLGPLDRISDSKRKQEKYV